MEHQIGPEELALLVRELSRVASAADRLAAVLERIADEAESAGHPAGMTEPGDLQYLQLVPPENCLAEVHHFPAPDGKSPRRKR